MDCQLELAKILVGVQSGRLWVAHDASVGPTPGSDKGAQRTTQTSNPPVSELWFIIIAGSGEAGLAEFVQNLLVWSRRLARHESAHFGQPVRGLSHS